MGYTGQYSVLPGEPITLYASTTAREFTVKAFRMGWYRGDQARLVWQSKSVPGRQQSASTVTAEVNTVETDWGPSLTIPTDNGRRAPTCCGWIPKAAGSGWLRSPCGRPAPRARWC